MHGKLVFRITGVSVAIALGLIAFAAAGAQKASAATRGVFKVLGLTKLTSSVVAEAEGQTVFLVPTYVVPFTIVCPKFATTEGLLLTEGVIDLKLLFEECQVWNSAMTEVLPCKTGDATADLLLLAMSHEGKTYVLAVGKNPKKEASPVFVEFQNKKEGGCLLPDKVFVMRGTQAFELVTGDLQKGSEVVEPLIQAGGKAVQELLADKLLFGADQVTLDSSIKLRLAGVHMGCKWGAI